MCLGEGGRERESAYVFMYAYTHASGLQMHLHACKRQGNKCTDTYIKAMFVVEVSGTHAGKQFVAHVLQ